MDNRSSGQPLSSNALPDRVPAPRQTPKTCEKHWFPPAFRAENPDFSPDSVNPFVLLTARRGFARDQPAGKRTHPGPARLIAPLCFFGRGGGLGAETARSARENPETASEVTVNPPKLVSFMTTPPPAAGAGGPRPLTPGVASRLATPGASPRGQWTSGQLPPGTVHRSGQLQPGTVPRCTHAPGPSSVPSGAGR